MSISEGYIGISYDPDRRFKEHKTASYFNPYLRKALHKYDDITMEILHCCFSEQAALELEYQYRPTINIGWNLNAGGAMPPNQTGYKYTPEAKVKISERSKGANNPMYGKTGFIAPSTKPANIYNSKTNELLASNVCIEEWAKQNGCRANHLQATARNQRKSHNGFYAIYIKDKL